MGSLEKLFNPSSVAVVGVSEDPTKLGSVLFSNIIDSGFKGKVYPVNPKHEKLFGVKAYKSVSAIKGKIDLVAIAVPAKFVIDVMKDAGRKRVRAAIVITAGFKEVGDDGIELEKQLLETAKRYKIRLLGPNCLGMINPMTDLNASFAASTPEKGKIGFLSQSGAFCTAILDMAVEKNLGFSYFVSLGNKADIDELDLLDMWYKDENVKVIGAYLEEISKGKDMVDLVRSNDNRKPLIMFKPGKSLSAMKAISSHTGSMAGSTETFQAAIKQNGIIESNEVNEMFYTMMGFAWSPLPKGPRVAVVTNAGGPGIIATDEIAEHGLEMAEISAKSKRAMRNFLPPTASVENPIDVIGDALAQRYRAPIDVLMQDENVDSILVILTPQLVTQIEETAKLIISSAKLYEKPIYAVFLGGKYAKTGLQRLYDNKIPAFLYIQDAVKVIEKMHTYQAYCKKAIAMDDKKKDALVKNRGKGKYQKELQKLVKNKVLNPSESLVQKMAEEVGIDLPEQIISNDLKEILHFAEDRYPVVIKATTESIAHKTDVKALYLNIKDEQELISNFEKLQATIAKVSKTKTAEILVQEQIEADESLLIGANRDGGADVYEDGSKGFGHLIVIGKGGIYTEVYKDFQTTLVPSTRTEFENALYSTKVSKILRGARGMEKLAVNKVLDALEAVQKLVLLYPEIESLDINPIMINKKRAVAVDIKIFLK
ncbi:acetate--CoA ligase family protein [Candidatus Dojkabacteria bacterium]|nr:acetate--CoA ligase family protein [Candidatus Dojkabacteria bacterium]